MPNCKKISHLTNSIGMNHVHLDEPGLWGLFWCVTSTCIKAQMCMTCLQPETWNKLAFLRIWYLSVHSLLNIYFSSHIGKQICKTLQTGYSGKESKHVPVAHFSISSQTYLTQEWVSQQATMKSSWILPMDSNFLPFSVLMIMEAYLCTVLLLPQKPSAVSCNPFQLW